MSKTPTTRIRTMAAKLSHRLRRRRLCDLDRQPSAETHEPAPSEELPSRRISRR